MERKSTQEELMLRRSTSRGVPLTAFQRSKFDDVKLWKKLALIVFLATLPACFLAYLLVKEKNIAIDFGEKELAGNVYLRPLRAMMDSAVRLTFPFENREKLLSQAEQQLSKVKHLQNSPRNVIQTGHTIQNVETALQQVRAGAAEPARLVAAIREAISKVGDDSNLILDPDLDSYYMMDSTVIIMPDFYENLSVATVEAIRLLDKVNPTPEERADLIMRRGLIQNNLLKLARGYEVGFQQNFRKNLQPKLAQPLAAMQASVQDLLNQIAKVLGQAGQGTTKDIETAGSVALSKTMDLWVRSTDGLDELLVARIDGFQQRKFAALGAVATAFAVCLVFLFVISRRISGRTARLASVAHGIAERGQLDDDVARQLAVIESHDEIGDLARSLQNMAEHLRRYIDDLQRSSDQLEEANATLEQKVEERTAALRASNDELSSTLDQLQKTKDQLIVQEKMASLGSLTAGIAHEIKNPLNFVNNFADLSAELCKELNETLHEKRDTLEAGFRQDIEDIISDLEINVRKINEHGKRADGIVRGMLQHSRGKTGDFVETDVNALLAEYVNLAYHGLRARDNTFNVTIDQKYDGRVGAITVVPQDVSRVFLNLVNNACYAADQKKRLMPAPNDFAPTLTVRTTALGDDWIEVRIRDNGPGIPQSMREKIFEPFFTTKPTGQGTGLGLSLSYDIIVQQHGGELLLETEEGQFAEFIIRLPRRSSPAKIREMTEGAAA